MESRGLSWSLYSAIATTGSLMPSKRYHNNECRINYRELNRTEKETSVVDMLLCKTVTPPQSAWYPILSECGCGWVVLFVSPSFKMNSRYWDTFHSSFMCCLTEHLFSVSTGISCSSLLVPLQFYSYFSRTCMNPFELHLNYNHKLCFFFFIIFHN